MWPNMLLGDGAGDAQWRLDPPRAHYGGSRSRQAGDWRGQGDGGSPHVPPVEERPAGCSSPWSVWQSLAPGMAGAHQRLQGGMEEGVWAGADGGLPQALLASKGVYSLPSWVPVESPFRC